MRGRSTFKKRIITPDPIYNRKLLAQFINRSMVDGKKTTIQRSVYDAMDILKAQGHDPLQVFENAIENIGPKVEVRAKRIGGAAYQVPMEVRGTRRISLGIRWLLEATKKRSNSEFKSFAAKLAAELLAANQNEGEAMRKKEIAHRMAEANKAFAHFRF